jgi:hypothetical protein
MYTIYDRIFGGFPAKIPYINLKYVWFWPTLNIWPTQSTAEPTQNSAEPTNIKAHPKIRPIHI